MTDLLPSNDENYQVLSSSLTGEDFIVSSVEGSRWGGHGMVSLIPALSRQGRGIIPLAIGYGEIVACKQ